MRDLTLVDLGQQTLIIGCDSTGAVGPKSGDQLQVSGELLGRMIAVVPIMEVMASGALPVAIIDTLSVEMHPTGENILNGIKKSIEEAGLPLSLINGSTEENFPTSQTGMGVTVVGVAERNDLRIGSSVDGDIVYLVGKPLVGAEVLDKPRLVAGIKTLRYLLEVTEIHEILPVGSKGVDYELKLLAITAGLSFEYLLGADKVDMQKSAGPATCVLATGEREAERYLKELHLPVTPIAILKPDITF